MIYEWYEYKNEKSRYDGTWKKYIAWETDENGDPFRVSGTLKTYIDETRKKWIIPEGVARLSANCFIDEANDIFDNKASEITLPASLTVIEADAFAFCNLTKITVAPGNQNFTVKDNGLYTIDGKRIILSFPKNYGELFTIAEGTELIDANAFMEIALNGSPIRIPSSVSAIGEGELELRDVPYIIAEKGSFAEEFAKKNGVEVRYQKFLQ